MSIEQSSREYKEEIVPLALAAILIYPVGLVVLNSSLLFCARTAIVKKRSTTLSRATTFLHQEFEVRSRCDGFRLPELTSDPCYTVRASVPARTAAPLLVGAR